MAAIQPFKWVFTVGLADSPRFPETPLKTFCTDRQTNTRTDTGDHITSLVSGGNKTKRAFAAASMVEV